MAECPRRSPEIVKLEIAQKPFGSLRHLPALLESTNRPMPLRSCLFGGSGSRYDMKLQILVVGILLLVIGGIIEAVGVAEFFSCSSSFFSNCNLGTPTTLLVFGGVVFFVGIIVSIAGVVVGVAPHLKGLSTPNISNPIVTEKEVVVTREVLIQCRSCGARYPQGTLKCLTCGANL